MQVKSLNEFLSPKISILVVLLGAVLLTFPIFLNGVPQGNDLPQHFQFAATFDEALRSGDLSPGLSTTTNSGCGDVGVRFYPPFSYYIFSLFNQVTGSWFLASSLAFYLWFFVGGLGVYLWAREFFEDAGSLAAAFVYMAAPYHVNEVYNASLFAEFAAVGILPFCFLFVSRICKNRNLPNLLGLAVFYALLILTHLPSSIIGSVGLAVFALLSLTKSDRFKTGLSLAFSIGTGFLLSSYYWIKVVTEFPWVNHATSEFVLRAYDFRSNFIASYFYTPAEVYGDRSLGFSDLMALMAACLFVPSLIFCVLGNRCWTAAIRAGISGALAVFLVALFFATPVSSAVWENVSFLQKIQFPFRWMILINVAGAFFVAAGFGAVASAFASNSRPLAMLAIGLGLVAIAFTAAQVIRPAMYIPKEGFDTYVGELSHAKSYACWWPVWAKEAALKNDSNVSVPATYSGRYDKHFKFAPDHPPEARLAPFYYPHWKAEINGNTVPVAPDENGAMLIQLPEGQADVRVFFEEPIMIKTAATVSVVAWFVVLTILLSLLGPGFTKLCQQLSK